MQVRATAFGFVALELTRIRYHEKRVGGGLDDLIDVKKSFDYYIMLLFRSLSFGSCFGRGPPS